MLKSKKVIVTLMLSLILVIGSVVTVFADTTYSVSTRNGTPNQGPTSMPGSDNWTRGVKSYGNGWYMGFSYYYNTMYWHWVKVEMCGETNYRDMVAPYTQCVNTNDYKGTTGFQASCGIDTSPSMN